ncbi:retrovirus-related pol polyprotein from transposon TNT 1-94 [Tanacetum coccineum]
MKNNGAPIIKDWVSDSEEEDVPHAKIEKKIVKPSFAKIKFVKSKEQVKSPKKTTVKQGDQNRQNTHTPRGNQRNWNNMISQRLGSNFEKINKAFYMCGSFDHLQYDCDNHQRQFNNKKMVKPVWNYTQRVNHQNFSRITHPSPKRNMVPKAVLMRSGLVSLTTARPVNTAQPKTIVNSARPMKNRFNTVSDKNDNTSRKAVVNAARPKAVLNAVKGNQVNAVKASACWVWKPKTKFLDHVSKHNNASITLKKFDYVDAQGRSKCNNGTKFKNKEMNQFCERKGIKREFSIVRTPQQNRVAERKNRTLIEAGRTMLADSKLPTTFWAEAVNTACYVQNMVIVTKPHNKTPYELFLGRKPALGFIRPFGYLVTILNTIDHLGKFDGKADEGFFIGYSINSNVFRVFNSRTRIVEENLHVQFSENTPNIEGSGPNWLFDIDALTNSMNYKPIITGNQSNSNAGTKACDDAGKSRMETVLGKDYMLGSQI